MSDACALRLGRFAAAVAILASIAATRSLRAQSSSWNTSSGGFDSPFGLQSAANSPARSAPNENGGSYRRAPLAHLIENPDQSEGAPPDALTDQNGMVQRYVEPVPGIDLSPYVGQVVAVRNDTGPTLLASQLDLPRQPLYPMVNESWHRNIVPLTGANRKIRRPMSDAGRVEQAQYVDGDDSVQLLPDDVSISGGGGSSGEAPPLEVLGNGGEFSGYPGQMMPGGGMYGPDCDSQCCEPIQCEPGMMQPYSGPMIGPYPQYGSYAGGSACNTNGCNTLGDGADSRVHVYGAIDLDFLRAHLSEDKFGKLSETYELSPTYILGVRNLGAVDGRIRYWNYSRNTNVLGDGDIRLKWDVADFEAVHRFEGQRSSVDLSAGIRLAKIRLRDDENAKSGSNLAGLTMAADGLTACHCMSEGYYAWVYGGRLSLLGGNWSGDDDSAFVDHHVSDDNVLVTELYAGAGRSPGRQFQSARPGRLRNPELAERRSRRMPPSNRSASSARVCISELNSNNSARPEATNSIGSRRSSAPPRALSCGTCGSSGVRITGLARSQRCAWKKSAT